MIEVIKIGRPRESHDVLTSRLSFRVSASDVDQIRVFAEKHEVTTGRWVRQAIQEKLAKERGEL